MPHTPNRIEKQVILKAPPARVWQALSNAEEFGEWFGVNYAGEAFIEGKDAAGKMTNPAYSHFTMTVTIEKIVPERLISFRWRPYPLDQSRDYSAEPKTLVEFVIEPHTDGTLLRVTETGFDGIPEDRRDEAFRMNEGGWAGQMEQIKKHLDG